MSYQEALSTFRSLHKNVNKSYAEARSEFSVLWKEMKQKATNTEIKKNLDMEDFENLQFEHIVKIFDNGDYYQAQSYVTKYNIPIGIAVLEKMKPSKWYLDRFFTSAQSSEFRYGVDEKLYEELKKPKYAANFKGAGCALLSALIQALIHRKIMKSTDTIELIAIGTSNKRLKAFKRSGDEKFLYDQRALIEYYGTLGFEANARYTKDEEVFGQVPMKGEVKTIIENLLKNCAKHIDYQKLQFENE